MSGALFCADEIRAATGGRLVRGDGAARAAGVSTDTRTLAAGELFIALAGPRFDGADFIAAAMARGAAGVVAARGARPPAREGVFLIEVADTLRALGDLARAYRRRFAIPVAGVTGSNGKTTTKEMIAAILSARGETFRSEGNMNNLVGLPQQVFRLNPGHAAAVFEMGMSAAGEIRRLAAIARPEVAVITNVGRAHIAGLGSMEAVRDAKGEILEADPAICAVLSNEDEYSRLLAARHEAAGGRVIRFGFSPQSDFRADAVRMDAAGAEFTLCGPGGRRPVRIHALGRHNVLNALAAAACAAALGVGLDAAAAGLPRARPPEMRFQVRRLPGRGDLHLLDDSYNANPESLARALETASALKGAGRLISVLGDMAELGPFAEPAHREAGRKAAACGVSLFAGVGPLMRFASDAARRAGMDAARVVHFDSPAGAADWLGEVLGPGDWLLVKGSRSMRMERVIEGLAI